MNLLDEEVRAYLACFSCVPCKPSVVRLLWRRQTFAASCVHAIDRRLSRNPFSVCAGAGAAGRRREVSREGRRAPAKLARLRRAGRGPVDPLRRLPGPALRGRRRLRLPRHAREERRPAVAQPARHARGLRRRPHARNLPAEGRPDGGEGDDGRREVQGAAVAADGVGRADAPLLHPMHQGDTPRTSLRNKRTNAPHARTHIVSPSCASCSAHLRVASSHRCSHLLLAPQSNHNKAPNQMEMRMCIEQMTYAGVFEAVKIRKSGYPFRYSHAQFANIYRWISRKANGWTCAAASAPRTIETGRLAEPCASVCRASMAQSAAHHSRVLTTHHAGTGRQADPGRPAARPGALLPGDPGDGAAGLFARPDRPHAGALPRRGAPRPRAAQEPRTRPRLPAHAGKQCNTLSFDDSSRLSATTPCLTTNP